MSISYSLLFWTDGLSNIIAGFALLFLLPKSVVAHTKQVTDKSDPAIRSPYKDKTFLFFIGCMLLFALCFFQLFTTVPLYFKETLKLGEHTIGLIMAMNGIIIGVFEMVIVFKIEGKRPYQTLMTYGTLLMGGAFLLLNLPLANMFAIAFIAMITITIAEIIGMPFMNSYYISRTNTANRGSYAGLFTMAWSFAQVIGSLTGTQVAHHVGYNNLWFIIAGVCVVAAAGFNALHKKQ